MSIRYNIDRAVWLIQGMGPEQERRDWEQAFHHIFDKALFFDRGLLIATMDRYAQILVDRILSLCKSRGITINKLSEMSGVSQSTIDNLVNGHTFDPRVRTLHRIALAFSMTLAEFLDFQDLNDYSFEDASND